MKRILTFIFSAVSTVLMTVPVHAQEIIPDDPELIRGKLDNGMTYYIRHNENPAGCADFYIIHNVGSLQEEDNQNGLAHFLEHMAFNGTRHYPDKGILEFLAKDGVRFGYNVNAYTNRTETVYNISSVPLVRDSFVDSVLMVLHDWSCDISCEPEALDAERGVISEEWRRKDEPRMRMMEKQNSLVYKGAKHTQRNVLGTLEVINGFKPQEILDFYHKWYRPDLQAIVVVGDFDADMMEQKVRKMFSDIPASVNPAPKETYPIPALDEPLFENMLDPQVKYHVLKVIHKQPFPARDIRNTDAFYKDLYARQIITSVLADRMSEDARKKGSPVSSAVLVTNPYSDDFYISLFTLSMKGPDNAEAALAFYTREVQRMLRYGISEDEFEAAKFKIMKKYRLNMEDFASDVTNRQIVDACKENFLRGFTAAFPYDLKEEQKIILGNLSYDDVRGYEQKMFRDSGKIYSWCMNEKEEAGLPDAAEMKEIIAAAEAEDIQPEYLSYEKIQFGADPRPGTVVKVRPVKGTDCEEWTLSNGARVCWIPSGPVKSNTHLSMTVYFDTGLRAVPSDKVRAARLASAYMQRYAGFGKYDFTTLRNSPDLSGADISLDFGQKNSSLSVTADGKSLEKGFRLVHAMLSDPYFSEAADLEKLKQGELRSLGKKKSHSDMFKKEARALRYGNHPWMADIDSSDVEMTDMDFVKDVYHRNFGDFRHMTAFIASDFPKEEVKALVCKYMASLDGEYDVEFSRTAAPEPAYRGKVVLDRTYDVETVPKAEVSYCFKGKTRLDPKNLAIIEILDYIMSGRYLQQIREVRGGTYHVSFSTEVDYSDNGMFESFVDFQTRPEMVDVLVKDVEDGMSRMAEEGPDESELDEAKKYLVKHRAEKDAAAANSLAARKRECSDFVRYGVSHDYDYEEVIVGITADDIRKFVSGLEKGDKFVTIYREE